jgi:uncharacterized protein (DUF924 family)
VREAPETLGEFFLETLQCAQEHAQIVRRFGRFPHRNRILHRAATAEEDEYLRTAEQFGQDFEVR